MPKNKADSLQQVENSFLFPALDFPFISHGVFNRYCGISPAPWDSCNVSFGLGDSPENVRANRERIKKTLGLGRLVSARQVHGSRVYTVAESLRHDLEAESFDALITDVPSTGLMIQQADCQAVFLVDPVKQAIGIAHAGWRGTVADIVAETVYAMSQEFSTETADLTAAISPSLGPCCAEFVNFRSELPVNLHSYQVRTDYFDFWAISRDQLCAAGVRPENIHTAGVCTRCSKDYFSYRRNNKTGRFASVIGIRR